MSKKKFKTILCGCITALCLLLTSCGSLQISQGSGNQDSDRGNQTTTETTFASTGNIESVDTLEEVPEYTGQPYVEINDNEPIFTEDELTTDSYEEYSPLDELGRCQTAEACVGEDLMPTQKRESISSVKPTGWVNKEYDGIDGGYLYNRCHLIGFQLTGENANERNLITGTRYMNVDGMLPFEDEVADYVKETDNHVMYRVTPIYSGDDLVASGVQMEAKSVEDGGTGVTFNVYVYNVQPYVVINYETGESYQTEELATPEGEWAPGTEAEVTDKNESNSSTTSKSTKKETYILNRNTNKFHKSTCSGVKDIKAENKEEYTGSRSDLIKEGYEPCGRCKP